ncbi:pseudouridylate synthase RPUSD4, mitochondrial [Megachile rotundata]|uniref:pseudouridylate synthase RPUSD4, mitochondrial n=1 Tax=Megachile rotundata TaxID=143995 RepID=UPI000258F8E0|nr:PREDICTED: RNA pseudouridylate synthase domain-containing protein 4-like [Megachile rotundata]
MVYLIIKSAIFKHTTICAPCIKLLKRNFAELQPISKKALHPYKQIHPWKSMTEFSEDLLANIIFNEDGLVALNKPYGIKRDGVKVSAYGVPNAVNYTLTEAVPYISKHLGYPNLAIIKCPEMYMSGVTLLATNEKIQRAVEVSVIQNKYLSYKYWVVTCGKPKQLEGKHRVAMKSMQRPNHDGSKAVIVTSWSKNDEKLNRIKLLNTEFKILSNSILDLCSLVEITSSTKRWHAIRLYASTYLYSPILGDNVCGSRVKKVGNTHVKVDPFLETANAPPKLNKRLLQLLAVSEERQIIIPAHIHLKKVVLPNFYGKDVTIEAPLPPSFHWTCKQLDLQY